MKKIVDESFAEVSDVGRVIMESYALGFGLPADFFAPHFERHSSLLRMIKYPPTSGEKIGIGEHTDYGCLTLID